MKRSSAHLPAWDSGRATKRPPSSPAAHRHPPTGPRNGATSDPHKKEEPSKRKRYLGCSRLEDYQLLDKLGEGTFGEVHKAQHKQTGELVALKRILMHNEKEGVPITALREIKILKSLSFPSVVPLSDIAIKRGDRTKRERGSIYMVFPYMDHDLSGLLENPKVQFSVPQIKLYMQQLLEGTLYLHQNKILHRDMKAANLLINNKGSLMIADFGLARPFEDGDKEYTNCVVTRWYRPPELLLGERKYTTAIDMWGIGCVMAEMLKGKPILPGTTDVDQLDRIFRLCGSPTAESMPGWDALPGIEGGVKSFNAYPRRVKDEFGRFGTQAADLLDHLLRLNPRERLSADKALEHDYFYTDPMPAKPDSLPHYDASHEYDRRKQKLAAQEAAAQRRNEMAHSRVRGPPPPQYNGPNGRAGGNRPSFHPSSYHGGSNARPPNGPRSSHPVPRRPYQ